MQRKLLEINLFGACVVRSLGAARSEIVGTKQKALFALLATAPLGRRTRAFLQDTLWGVSCYDSGRQSLRRALADIKLVLGDTFGAVISSNNSEITLHLDRVEFMGRPGSGEFLEGMDIREDGFNHWLTAIRVNPQQVYSLFSLRSQPAPKPVLPTFAVLPFQVVRGGPDTAVLGDWLAEEICRSLSRSNLLAVISHLSSRQLNRTTVSVEAVRDKLAADYCVVGCLRAQDDRIVLDADFLDTVSGRILWTRQFAGSVDNFIDPNASGVIGIVSAVGRTIADEAITYVAHRRLEHLEEHRLLIAGVGLMHRPTLAAFVKGRELIEELTRRAPTSAEAHAWLGKWYVLSVFNGWSTNPASDTRAALDCTARALDLNGENSFALTIDGFAQNNLLRRFDIAEKRYESALALNPNEALSWLLRGALRAFTDEPAEAVASVEHALRLSPLDPFRYFYDSLSASAHLSAGDFEKALDFAERSYIIHDRHTSTLRVKVAALHHLGRREEAQTAAGELLRRQPNLTVSDYLRNHPAADSRTGTAVAQALRASGIPA